MWAVHAIWCLHHWKVYLPNCFSFGSPSFGGTFFHASSFFLIFLVGSVIFILLLALVLTLVFLFLVVSDGAKLRVKLELAIEGVDFGRHGHDLFVVRRFGTPLTCILEIVEVGLRKAMRTSWVKVSVPSR